MFWHRMQRGSGSRRRDRLSQSLFCLCSAGPARVCGTVPSGEKDEGTFSLDWNTRVTSDLLYYTRSSSAGKVMWVARQAIDRLAPTASATATLCSELYSNFARNGPLHRTRIVPRWL